ncbi:NAC domain-containing protein 21/22-like [Zingiber officinale]|uniref:NAC domain-containing protein n=1 Tax=Zingiber officinale TaxID=94328 RepID=A0A8J5EBB2_ZINOF|nr:NAC domain-containing protein 21/22-like [Zingiber officinale]KAG6470177.1 hypothetical protein ZIOFF_071234 [Zingiber officinale]
MSNFLSMAEHQLPPGFRFHPRDEELVCDYLQPKLMAGSTSSYFPIIIIDVDLNKCEPWDLPDMACVGGKEWYFFSLRDRKYATGHRTNRATQSGYWKATGKDRLVKRKEVLVGMRKTLVFYKGRAPKGRKTDWVMHEFRMESELDSDSSFGPPKLFDSKQEDWVLCRVFSKSKRDTSKPTIETSSYHDISLPPLMESFIAMDPSSSEENEQVPCFSHLMPARTTNSISPQDVSATPLSQTAISEHADGMKLVSNHFTKMEVNSERDFPPDLPQGNLESYLSDYCLSQVWNTF